MNAKLYRRCERALLHEIATGVDTTLRRHLELSPRQRRSLLEDLVFAIAVNVSGSAFGGSVDGREVYPTLGFWLGELDDAVRLEGPSGMHEMAGEVVAGIVDAGDASSIEH